MLRDITLGIMIVMNLYLANKLGKVDDIMKDAEEQIELIKSRKDYIDNVVYAHNKLVEDIDTIGQALVEHKKESEMYARQQKEHQDQNDKDIRSLVKIIEKMRNKK